MRRIRLLKVRRRSGDQRQKMLPLPPSRLSRPLPPPIQKLPCHLWFLNRLRLELGSLPPATDRSDDAHKRRIIGRRLISCEADGIARIKFSREQVNELKVRMMELEQMAESKDHEAARYIRAARLMMTDQRSYSDTAQL